MINQPSICKAIEAAYNKVLSRKWDTIYIALDLHETVFEPTYTKGQFIFYPGVHQALKIMNEYKELKIIISSSLLDEDKVKVLEFFKLEGIEIFAINENPDESDTSYASFKEKYYFSILIDDKAGFDPLTDWKPMIYSFHKQHKRFTFQKAI
tara:strand:- start:1289 stop:1744 length:456 start_codon:yes stop_codon:yes gene_type:complete